MTANTQRAWLLMRQERYDLAEKEWRGLLAEDPESGPAHAGLGLCLVRLERYDDAEREAERAIQHAPDHDMSHFVRARVLQARRRYAEAVESAEESIRLAADDADNRALLADLRGDQGRWQDSLDAAEQGLALDAEHVGCLNLRALALNRLNRTEEASASTEDALARSPEDGFTHANHGWMLLHRGEHERSFEHFREALRLEPDCDHAREGLITALKARNAVYRRLLNIFLFLGRIKQRWSWILLLVLLGANHYLSAFARSHPEHGWWIWPLLATLLVYFIASWLYEPLGNLALRLHPLGRHALTPDQRMGSTLVAAGLVLTVAVWVMWSLKGVRLQVIPYNFLLLTACLSTIHDAERGWPRSWSIALTSIAGVLVVGSTVTLSWMGFMALTPSMVGAFLLLGSGLFLMHSFMILGAVLIGCFLFGLAQPKR